MRHAKIKHTGVSNKAQKNLHTKNVIENFRPTHKISAQYAGGVAVADMHVGKYCYNAIDISIVSANQIADVTISRLGKHRIKTAKMADYITEVDLRINGRSARKMSFERFLQFNELDGFNGHNGHAWMIFGGPNQFVDIEVEDAYGLGTANLESLQIYFTMTDDWDEGTMKLSLKSEYTPVNRPLAYFRSRRAFPDAAPHAGKYEMKPVPIKADIGAIAIFGESILGAQIEIDGIENFYVDYDEMKALNALYGTDTDVLGECFYIDWLRTKQIKKGIAALDGDAQRGRNAEILITLDMADAAQFEVVVDFIGRYSTQR